MKIWLGKFTHNFWFLLQSDFDLEKSMAVRTKYPEVFYPSHPNSGKCVDLRKKKKQTKNIYVFN